MTIDTEGNLYLTGKGVTVLQFVRETNSSYRLFLKAGLRTSVLAARDRKTLLHHRQRQRLHNSNAGRGAVTLVYLF